MHVPILIKVCQIFPGFRLGRHVVSTIFIPGVDQFFTRRHHYVDTAIIVNGQIIRNCFYRPNVFRGPVLGIIRHCRFVFRFGYIALVIFGILIIIFRLVVIFISIFVIRIGIVLLFICVFVICIGLVLLFISIFDIRIGIALTIAFVRAIAAFVRAIAAFVRSVTAFIGAVATFIGTVAAFFGGVATFVRAITADTTRCTTNAATQHTSDRAG